MSDDTYARFKMKLTVNGYTQADGHFTATAINSIVNDFIMRFYAPPIDFSIMHRYSKGAHIHADMLLGKALLAYEIECIADPEEAKPSAPPSTPPTDPEDVPGK